MNILEQLLTKIVFSMGQGTVPCPNPNETELTYGDKKYTWESGHNLKSITDVENEISKIVEKFTH